MNTFSSPDARFWEARIRPVETLVWVGRPGFTVTLGWPVLWAVGPASLGASYILWMSLITAPNRPDTATTYDFTMLACIGILAYCAFYLLRFGLLFPFQARYAITDRRLMVWRRGQSPALVDEEIDLSLKLKRAARPRNSVLFASDLLQSRGTSILGIDLSRKARRPEGFLNPQDSDGMERALSVVLGGYPGAWR